MNTSPCIDIRLLEELVEKVYHQDPAPQSSAAGGARSHSKQGGTDGLLDQKMKGRTKKQEKKKIEKNMNEGEQMHGRKEP